jgi:hypothetical protein
MAISMIPLNNGIILIKNINMRGHIAFDLQLCKILIEHKCDLLSIYFIKAVETKQI